MPIINVGDNWQTAINAGSAGDTFTVAAGVHRHQTATPKNNQTFTGITGAVMSGAQLFVDSDWVVDGARWYASGQTQGGTAVGLVAERCILAYQRCVYSEDLFFNDVIKIHVDSLGQGGAGNWFFDYAADRIYVWDNPIGRVVETSLTAQAFIGSATGVTVQNLVIEKYANAAQVGAIQGGVGWVIQDNEIRYNHGVGIWMNSSLNINHNNIHHNGQIGIAGTGSGSTVNNNEIAYNNTVGFNPYWEAGGTKFTFTNGLTISNNFVHHNIGPGLWCDIDNINIIYEYNRCEDNAYSGIMHEISYAAIIRFNQCRRNGAAPPIAFWADGCGILIATSTDVEVYGNYLEDNWENICGLDQNRGAGGIGVWSLQNLNVHDNTTVSYVNLGSGTGLTGFFGNLAASTSKNNHFIHNTYYLGAATNYFNYLEAGRTESYWQSVGNDVTGTIIRGAPPSILGTGAVGMTEADIRAGGKTIIITLSGTTFVA